MIASSDVDSARSCDSPSSDTSAGTKRIPPPIPSAPLETPAQKPTTAAPATSTALTATTPHPRGPDRASDDQHDGRGDQQKRERARDGALRHALLEGGARDDPTEG